jgi:AcrR family transcriptional regulator
VRLLRAAEELFTRRGYAETGVSDVAERARVGVGTLYHHFPDKRSLLLELIDDWGDRLVAERRGDIDHERFLGRDPRAAFRGWLRRSYERLRKQPSLYLVVLGRAERDEDVRRRYRRIEQVGVERLCQLIEFGQRRGLMRRSVEPRTAAFLIHCAIDVAATQLLVHEVSGPDPERVLEELADMICRYVLED